MSNSIVFDIGGMSTKICIVKEGIICKRDLIEYDYGIKAIDLVNKMDNKIKDYITEIETINISTCGVVNPNSGEFLLLSAIKESKELNFKKSFAKYGLPIFIENDANCAAIGEMNFGAAKGIKNFISLVVGTGIGGSIVINGKLLKTSSFMSGEFGAGFFKYEKNNIESYSLAASASVISRKYNNITEKNLETKEIFEIYNQDLNAKKIIDETILNLSILIVNLKLFLDTDAFIIGGAISKNQFYINQINSKVAELMEELGIPMSIHIKSAILGNDANIMGAYSLK
ncbi:hypothetical protein CG006_01635 [Mesoplasma florum]|uniref:ROK family protein n=1 Tax=Mesoplasma florum TaxID=2151 RepID=UPI000D03F33C|nr:ROK family protein [Mesoplasma florum]AVN63680.1 hypothetical protein CG006_01635 [Mesoplasma florum]